MFKILKIVELSHDYKDYLRFPTKLYFVQSYQRYGTICAQKKEIFDGQYQWKLTFRIWFNNFVEENNVLTPRKRYMQS
jgi:hypothetical protein